MGFHGCYCGIRGHLRPAGTALFTVGHAHTGLWAGVVQPRLCACIARARYCGARCAPLYCMDSINPTPVGVPCQGSISCRASLLCSRCEVLRSRCHIRPFTHENTFSRATLAYQPHKGFDWFKDECQEVRGDCLLPGESLCTRCSIGAIQGLLKTAAGGPLCSM